MLIVPYMLVLLMAVGAASIVAWLRVRKQRHRHVVQTLAVIVGQNLPLPETLRATARNEGGRLRGVYERMARRLEAGDTLATALRASMLSCPGDVIGAVQAGERGGTVPTVLRGLAADMQRAREPALAWGPLGLYCLVLLVVVPLVQLFIMVTVIPKFRDIFADYGTELPALTEAVVDASSSGLLWGVVLVIVVFALAAIQSAVLRSFWARMPDRVGGITAVLDGLAWRTPGVRRAVEARALARQMPILQAALRAGHDLPAAAGQAACVDANYYARRRLRRWAERLEQGNDALDAARRLRFPAPVLRVLAAARGGADLPTALEYLGWYYRRLSAHWQRVLVSAMLPLVVLCWALAIGTVVVSLYLPLVSMIEWVSGSVY